MNHISLFIKTPLKTLYKEEKNVGEILLAGTSIEQVLK
jgi:hypothetical protein